MAEADHLTPAQKAKLEEELAQLEGPERRKVVEAIATARAFGDLSENFEYHAAKHAQGLLEARISKLRQRLRDAVVIDEAAAAASDVVVVGSYVQIEDEDGERMEVEISSAGGVSPSSPLGRALMGKRIDDVVEVEAPSGSWRARIVSLGR